MVCGAHSWRQGGQGNKCVGKRGLQSGSQKKWALVLSLHSPYSVWELGCDMTPPSPRAGPPSSHKLLWKHHNRIAHRCVPSVVLHTLGLAIKNGRRAQEMAQLVKCSQHIQEVQSSVPQGPNKKTCVQWHVSVIWAPGRMGQEKDPQTFCPATLT